MVGIIDHHACIPYRMQAGKRQGRRGYAQPGDCAPDRQHKPVPKQCGAVPAKGRTVVAAE